MKLVRRRRQAGQSRRQALLAALLVAALGLAVLLAVAVVRGDILVSLGAR